MAGKWAEEIWRPTTWLGWPSAGERVWDLYWETAPRPLWRWTYTTVWKSKTLWRVVVLQRLVMIKAAFQGWTGDDLAQTTGGALMWYSQGSTRSCLNTSQLADQTFSFCLQIGKIYEMRMMMDFNGNNRGYAFVTFSNKQEAKNAIKQLNNYEIR